MDKKQLTQLLNHWLNDFLLRKFSSSHELILVKSPETALSKLNDEVIKQIPNYSAWEFKPDVFAILKNKQTGKLELVLLNRSTSALSLKELGEMHCYARLTGAILSIVASTNGVSNEVNILLLEDNIRQRILKYSDSEPIIIIGWDEKNNRIREDSVIPFEKRDFILN